MRGQELVTLRLDGRASCDPTIVSNCEEAEHDPQLPYVLRPLRPDPPVETQRETVGLLVENATRSLVVRDFRLVGFDVGIKIEGSLCGDCDLMIENGTIEGAVPKQIPVGKQEGTSGNLTIADFRTAIGIEVVNGPRSVTVRDVSISMVGGGELIEGEYFFAFAGGSLGIALYGNYSWLHVSNVSITSSPLSVRNGVGFGIVDNLEMRGILAKGFAFGINGFANNSVLDGIAIQEGKRAMDIRVGDSLKLTNFQIEETETGINLWGRGRNGNHYDSRGEFANGVVSNNGLRGMWLDTLEVAMANVSFTDNGHNWSATSKYPPEKAGALNFFESVGTVRQSQFVGNNPYGLSAPHIGNSIIDARVDLAVDARENWWGSSMGPRFHPSFAGFLSLRSTPEGGDAVSERVLFAPFLTAPPGQQSEGMAAPGSISDPISSP